jgi:hypothetical protein
MSCDNSIHHTTVALDACLCLGLELGDYAATTRKPDLKRHKSPKQGELGLAADQSRSNGHRHDVQSRIILDSTQVEPEYVWGDEGPIND